MFDDQVHRGRRRAQRRSLAEALLDWPRASLYRFQQRVRNLKVAKTGHQADIRLIASVIVAPAGHKQVVARRNVNVKCAFGYTVTAIDRLDAVQSELGQLRNQLVHLFERRKLQLIRVRQNRDTACCMNNRDRVSGREAGLSTYAAAPFFKNLSNAS